MNYNSLLEIAVDNNNRVVKVLDFYFLAYNILLLVYYYSILILFYSYFKNTINLSYIFFTFLL
jgi:hypothetical protein